MLIGQNIKLVKFTDSFVSAKYASWLNDQDVNRFLLTGRIPISVSELSNRNDYCNIIFGIMTDLLYNSDNDNCEKTNDFTNYIGVISIDGIDWINRKGEISYMIGEKDYWGFGIATEAVKLISGYAFSRLNLNKLEAGVVDGNNGSINVLERNGFVKYATVPEDYFLKGEYRDVLRFYKLQS